MLPLSASHLVYEVPDLSCYKADKLANCSSWRTEARGGNSNEKLTPASFSGDLKLTNQEPGNEQHALSLMGPSCSSGSPTSQAAEVPPNRHKSTANARRPTVMWTPRTVSAPRFVAGANGDKKRWNWKL